MNQQARRRNTSRDMSGGKPGEAGGVEGARLKAGLRIFALIAVAAAFAFLFNNYLNFWRGWPGVPALMGQLGWLGFSPPRAPLDGVAIGYAVAQVTLYLAVITAVFWFVMRTPARGLTRDAESLTGLAAFIIRAMFWGVLLVGLADLVISFLRVEGLLAAVTGDELAALLGRPRSRGAYIHMPLLAAGFVIAYFTRSLGFHWLALMIVLAEIQIVVARFIFSYEQAFMADLVRFWYGALFLFASAYTLIAEGHVRVDILYTAFSDRGKAWANVAGSVLLGLPLCWVILTMGMWGRSDLINGPLIDYEVTQAGFGLYVKYLLAGFLGVFALTMLVQFMGYFLANAAVLVGDAKRAASLDEAA